MSSTSSNSGLEQTKTTRRGGRTSGRTSAARYVAHRRASSDRRELLQRDHGARDIHALGAGILGVATTNQRREKGEGGQLQHQHQH